MGRDKSVFGPPAQESKLPMLQGMQGEDFSCQEFGEQFVQGQNFFESIFNGCAFTGLRVSQSVFQHAEFTETSLAECIFEDTSFDYADFVLTTVTKCRFVRCSFQNAEWRDATFENVLFQQCIFRNTTTSLTEFLECTFDSSSASSFAGSSKRFSLFSRGEFHLPREQLDFLKTNFGITGADSVETHALTIHDPFFAISVERYFGKLSCSRFYMLALTALSMLIADHNQPNRLRLQYLAGICKILLRENALSIFVIEIMERVFSERARLVQNRDQALLIFSLILNLRVELQTRLATLERELADIPSIVTPSLTVRMEFERSFPRDSLDEYLSLLATFCELPERSIVVREFYNGSTTIDFIILAAASLPSIFRFLKYSLSMATITLRETTKLRKAYNTLTAAPGSRKIAKHPKGRAKRANLSDNLSQAIIAPKQYKAGPMEVFIDKAKERVLVVDGKVRITISLE